MDNFHFWTIVSLATAFAGAYVLWGPSTKVKNKKGYINGLNNPGTICFTNAILQSLASLNSFLSWLRIHQVYNYGLFKALHSTITDINDEENESDICSSSKVLKALSNYNWVISDQEQDAHEFYHALTSTLEEEAMNELAKSFTFDDICEVMKPINQLPFPFNYKIRNKASFDSSNLQSSSLMFYSPLRGLFTSQIRCQNCGYKYPLRYDTFDSISLVIPRLPRDKICTLIDCLRLFTSIEHIKDSHCERCSIQSHGDNFTKGTLLKQFTFGKLPECLVLHLGRIQFVNGMMSIKCHDFISFPEYLNMSDYLYKQIPHKETKEVITIPKTNLLDGLNISSFRKESLLNPLPEYPNFSLDEPEVSSGFTSMLNKTFEVGQASHLYVLQSVIIHYGDLSSGHFITYRRGPRNCWYYTSDRNVRRASTEEVFRSPAYMLFYEKCLPVNKHNQRFSI